MKTSTRVAAMAMVVTGMLLAATAQAQTKPIQAWQPPKQELDPAKRVPAAPAEVRSATSAASAPGVAPASAVAPAAPATDDAAPVPVAAADAAPAPTTATAPVPAAAAAATQAAAQSPSPRSDVGVHPGTYIAPQDAFRYGRDERRGGFFAGVKGGKGWVYDSVDQTAREYSLGYRWQAGPVALVGFELSSGRLDSTTDEGWHYGKVKYASIGANARFNFGRGNPVYGLVRHGYWQADDDDFGVDAEGAYLGLGLGMDFNRHFGMSLVWTSYFYFDDYAYDYYNEINRGDTLTLGLEARF